MYSSKLLIIYEYVAISKQLYQGVYEFFEVHIHTHIVSVDKLH